MFLHKEWSQPWYVLHAVQCFFMQILVWDLLPLNSSDECICTVIIIATAIAIVVVGCCCCCCANVCQCYLGNKKCFEPVKRVIQSAMAIPSILLC